MMEKRVPDWRFNQYHDSWKYDPLGKYIKKTGAKLGNRTLDAYSINNKVGLIKQDKLFENSRYGVLDKNSYKIVNPGEFAYNPARINIGSIGYNHLERAVSLSSLYVVFKTDKRIYDKFLWEYTTTPRFTYEVNCNTEGTVRLYLFYENLCNIKFPYTFIAEQQEIADYLTYIDNAIIAQETKLDNMRAMKRGAMQKIFSREWRFRDEDGRKFPEWEEKRLGDVCDQFYAGQTPKSTNRDFYNGDIPWLSSGDLNRGIICETEKKITEAGRKNANLKIMPKGTFVIAVFGLEADQVCGNCGILGIQATVNQACMCIMPNKKYLSSNFLFQWYLFMGKTYGNKYCQGTKQQNYNVELLKKLVIMLPCLAEQQKIADYFQRLDKIIEAESAALVAIREIKRGLLQRLFV